MGVEFKVREEVLEGMRRYVRESPTADIPFTAVKDKEYSMIDALKEVEEKTALGRSFYNAWEDLYEMKQEKRASKKKLTR